MRSENMVLGVVDRRGRKSSRFSLTGVGHGSSSFSMLHAEALLKSHWEGPGTRLLISEEKPVFVFCLVCFVFLSLFFDSLLTIRFIVNSH